MRLGGGFFWLLVAGWVWKTAGKGLLFPPGTLPRWESTNFGLIGGFVWFVCFRGDLGKYYEEFGGRRWADEG